METRWNFVGLLLLLAALFVMLMLWAPRKAHPAETGMLEVVQDFGGGQAPEFDKFFIEISSHLAKWWKTEGKTNTSQKWGVFVKLNPLLSADNNGGRPVLVICLINDEEGNPPILVGLVFVTNEKNLKKEANVAANIIAARIMKEEQKNQKIKKIKTRRKI